MFVFMICFFGFMDYMIVFKWTHVIEGEGTNGPPSIINSLICMAMFQTDAQPLWGGAGDFAHNLMTAAACAVPIMLFPKPFILRSMHNSKTPGASDEETGGHGHGHGGEFEFGEVFIHQIIETIEYVLGTVSHTASYLRIWALSLAHQQLSLVFYQKTLIMVFTSGLEPVPASIATFFAFAAWFGVTSGVLLGMDVLECFLHTLRLHWVEFQSKFYKSDTGVAFEPYSIRSRIKALE
jgi:V-type H+-transporting ATPase subunit a